jgi:hypothetical protein
LIQRGGEYGCDARVQLADLLLQTGDAGLAHAELNAVAKDPALGERHCELAAELLAAHGALDQAARWYDRAAARLADDQLDALRRRDDWLTIGTPSCCATVSTYASSSVANRTCWTPSSPT